MSLRAISYLSGLLLAIIAYTSEWLLGQDWDAFTPIVLALVPIVAEKLRQDVMEWRTPVPVPVPTPDPKPDPESVAKLASVLRSLEQDRTKADLGRTLGTPLVLAFLMLVPACACADSLPVNLEFDVNGPSQAQVGRRVHLDVKFIHNVDPKDVTLEYECLRQTNPEAVLQLDTDRGGLTARVWGDAAVYEIRVTARQKSNAENKFQRTHRLSLDGRFVPPIEPQPLKPDPSPKPVNPDPVPTPQPEPKPIPKPDPPVDPKPEPVQPPGPGEFDLAPKVFDLAVKSTSNTRVADCQMLARECTRIADATFPSINDLAKELVAVLNKLPAGWTATGDAIKTAIAAAYTSGKIKTQDDVKRLLRELAAAFELAGKVK